MWRRLLIEEALAASSFGSKLNSIQTRKTDVHGVGCVGSRDPLGSEVEAGCCFATCPRMK